MNFSKTWLTVLAAFAGGVIGSMLMQTPAPVEAQNKADTVVASEFVLRGKDGNTRARLSVDADNATTLALFDGFGNELGRLSVSAKADGENESALLKFQNKNKDATAAFGVAEQFTQAPDGNYALATVAGLSLKREFDHENTVSHYSIGMAADRHHAGTYGSSRLAERNGSFRIDLNSEGSKARFSHDNVERITTGIDATGAATLQLKDKEEKTTWSQSSR